jgi:hypothetical protein
LIFVNSDRDHKRIHISARIGYECIDILTFYESKLQIGSLNQKIDGIGNLVIFVTLAVTLKSGDPVILTLSVVGIWYKKIRRLGLILYTTKSGEIHILYLAHVIKQIS